jgi:histone acetyltransferase (RNA polymerase elongator complex component)
MKKFKHANIPIFLPELACPHQCVFCNQVKISGTLSVPAPAEVAVIVERHLSTLRKDSIVDIAFFGGSFTGIEAGLQEEYLKEAFQFVQRGLVSGIRVSTRPDYIQQGKLDLLKKYGVTTIELGAQSTDKEVLKKTGRGHTFDAIQQASALILENKFQLGLQMMIGLPGDTYERAWKTANDIISLGAHCTRIYPTVIIKDTALERLYKQGKYKPLELEEAVLWTRDLVKLFEKNNVQILRIGLHTSEELVFGKSLVAGPFHPSFKELVMSKLWNELIFKELERKTNTGTEVGAGDGVGAAEKTAAGGRMSGLTVRVNERHLNYAVGFNGVNKKELLKRGVSIGFRVDPAMEDYQFDLSYH